MQFIFVRTCTSSSPPYKQVTDNVHDNYYYMELSKETLTTVQYMINLQLMRRILNIHLCTCRLRDICVKYIYIET